ncbi:MAG: type II secretion system GspH family protein [Fusobacterium sp.]|nr:type II secretion system GspH family protein [Fusobacterium sp.]
MAEILLSLTIIGVVAAITLPSLTGNINERTWNTQRKALYARMSQAIALMPALNGYGTLSEDASGSVTQDNAAETFVTAGLSKVLKINNICDSDKIFDCGFSSRIITQNASNFSMPTTMAELNYKINSVSYVNPGASQLSYSYSQTNTKAVAFETVNGECVAAYYNPRCQALSSHTLGYVATKLCVNFVYDLNCSKGPNTIGKDMGYISVFYPTDSVVVAPYVSMYDAGNATHQNASKACTSQDSESRLPTAEEAASMFVNQYLNGMNEHGWFWTSKISEQNPANALIMHLEMGHSETNPRSNGAVQVRCVKR